MCIRFPVSLACAIALVAGCSASASVSVGTKAVSKHEIEQQIVDRLAAKYGQGPKAAVCPGDLKAEQGTTMRCQLEADDGTKHGATVTVTSVEGNDVKFNIQVDSK